MNVTRMYGRITEENDKFVIIEDGSTLHKLQRCRMYNSHLVKDMLYTEYADKEYHVIAAKTVDTDTHPRKRLYERTKTTA